MVRLIFHAFIRKNAAQPPLPPTVLGKMFKPNFYIIFYGDAMLGE